MAKKRRNIHDVFVRDTLSDLGRAASFFQEFLPDSLKQNIRLETLKALSESYVSEQLSEHFSDLVFEVQTLDQQQPLDIVFLFEHKSNPDKHVLIQIGHYLFAHWAKQASLKKQLKPVIPIVYYQGHKPWKAPSIAELFPKLKSPIIGFVPELKHLFFALNDLSETDISQIRHSLLASALMAQKKVMNPVKLAKDMTNIFALFPQEEEDVNFLVKLFVYVTENVEFSDTELEQAFLSVPEKVKVNVMTTYQQIREKSFNEGIEKGLKEKEIKVVVNGHKNGIEIEMLANITQLKESEVLEILKKEGLI